MAVYPSLPPHIAAALLEEIGGLEPVDLRRRSGTSHEMLQYPASGAIVSEHQLQGIAEGLRDIAAAEGYPESIGNNAHVRFDRAAAGKLYSLMEISPWSAADDGVWSFLTLVVLPDVAVWRYPERHPLRLIGGERNVFRRLWWRAEVLGPGPEDPPATLGEDQLVQIMERTDSIGRDPIVARALCRAIIAEQRIRPQLPGMMLMRDAAKRVNRMTSYLLLAAVPEAELHDLMSSVVRASADAIGGVG